MAKGGRRYARDARGRFSSTGTTALGGRLKSKSGKRGSQANSTASGNLGQRGLGTSAPKGTVARFSDSRAMAGKGQRFAGKSSKAGMVKPAAATAGERKKALIRDVSNKVLDGKGASVGKAKRNYIKSQQLESQRMERNPGKGNKAKRRMARMGK